MSKKIDKKRIVVLFSGGETSAFMLEKILDNYSTTHEILVIFANTGEENEETLIFVRNVSQYLNINIVWLEYNGHRSFKIVDFETAYRSHDLIEIANKWQNHPFRKYVEEYGLPNRNNPECTRELKIRTIERYLSSIGWTPKTRIKAIGIRADEIDRIGSQWYPLVTWGIIKPMVNYKWSKMPFRLELKGYQGNCKTCWKKGIRKLVTLYRENPYQFAFFKQLEEEYGYFIPKTKLEKAKKEGRKIEFPIRMFRENRSVDDISFMSLDPRIENAIDDTKEVNYQLDMWHGIELDVSNGCEESCEAH